MSTLSGKLAKSLPSLSPNTDVSSVLSSLTSPIAVHGGYLPTFKKAQLSEFISKLEPSPEISIAHAKLVKLGCCEAPRQFACPETEDYLSLPSSSRCELLWALGVLCERASIKSGQVTTLRRLISVQEVPELSLLELEQLLLGLGRLGETDGLIYGRAKPELVRRRGEANASSREAVEAMYWLSAYGEEVGEMYMQIAANRVDVLKVEEKKMARETLALLARRKGLSETMAVFMESGIFDRKHRSQQKWAQVRTNRL